MIIAKSDPFTKEEIKKKNKATLGALAMDLKRITLGLQRGSKIMAFRFTQEALKRESEIDMQNVDPYVRNILKNIKLMLSNIDEQESEDILMYSILLQNYARHKFST
ncbi:MAG: hypothetical protein AAB609_02625 [Patescibacteria group bacterium]